MSTLIICGWAVMWLYVVNVVIQDHYSKEAHRKEERDRRLSQ